MVMKNSVLLFMIVTCICSMRSSQLTAAAMPVLDLHGAKSAIITELGGGGRLGDQILFYIAVKWFSLQYDIPVIYRRNRHLDQLVGDEKDIPYYIGIEKQFDKVESITKDTHFDRNKSVLYQMPFRYACINVYQLMRNNALDKSFLTLLKSFMRPKKAVSTLVIPGDMISVAVHIRKGSGHDVGIAKLEEKYPGKFLPDTYYTDQIRRIADYFSNQQIYVYLFSDSSEVLELKRQYEQALLDKHNVIFDCNNSLAISNGKESLNNDFYVDTILNDLFSMVDFDCLIRSNSHFGRSAQIIGEHKIVIFPEWAYWDKNTSQVVIDKVNFVVQDSAWCEKKRAEKK